MESLPICHFRAIWFHLRPWRLSCRSRNLLTLFGRLEVCPWISNDIGDSRDSHIFDFNHRFGSSLQNDSTRRRLLFTSLFETLQINLTENLRKLELVKKSFQNSEHSRKCFSYLTQNLLQKFKSPEKLQINFNFHGNLLAALPALH